MIRMLCFTTALLLVAAVASAEQYWIAYEGNDFPENEGWVRYASDPPAERWLEDASLFIDSRADLGITESYGMHLEGGLDPDPGELFVMRLGLNVHQAAPWEDPGVAVRSDDQYGVIFIFAEGYLLSVYEPNVYVEFEPGVLHEFELRSTDMRSYALYIDDDLALEGVFFESLFEPSVIAWGDIVRGGSSLAQWDYFRFGVVPEPGSLILLVQLFCLSATRRSFR